MKTPVISLIEIGAHTTTHSRLSALSAEERARITWREKLALLRTGILPLAIFAAMLVALPFMGDAMQGQMARIAARIVSGG